MSKKLDRINQLISFLKEKNGASVKELSSILNVSEMTIRRDLHILKSNNIVNNVYGATIYNPSNTKENIKKSYSLTSAKTTNDAEKARIGKYAASLIEENDVIIIDSGSTTEELAKNINPSAKATILCYSINIVNRFINKNDIKLIFAGGYYHPNTQMFESPEGISLIHGTRASKVFVSAAGIHETLGITCATSYESPTKNAIIHSAVQRILIADSSKFGKVKSSYFADLHDFQVIVTDNGLSEGWADYISKMGIDLVMV